jgi:hypothetical protein
MQEIPMPPFESAVFVAPLPRNWENALGYTPAIPRRWLITDWTPFGDEAMYEDGIVSATCHWHPYLDLVQTDPLHTVVRQVARQHFGARWASDILGGSEREGTHGLLCDLKERRIYIADLREARAFVKPPLPQPSVPPSLEEQAVLWAPIQANFKTRQEQEVAARKGKRMERCFACVSGYVLAEDGGYEVCPACRGNHVRWVLVQEGKVPTIEIREALPLPEDFLAEDHRLSPKAE